MANSEVERERDERRTQLKKEFSNHENSVTLIASLEAWFDFRWGKQGKVYPGLLERFDRFPAARRAWRTTISGRRALQSVCRARMRGTDASSA